MALIHSFIHSLVHLIWHGDIEFGFTFDWERSKEIYPCETYYAFENRYACGRRMLMLINGRISLEHTHTHTQTPVLVYQKARQIGDVSFAAIVCFSKFLWFASFFFSIHSSSQLIFSRLIRCSVFFSSLCFKFRFSSCLFVCWVILFIECILCHVWAH